MKVALLSTMSVYEEMNSCSVHEKLSFMPSYNVHKNPWGTYVKFCKCTTPAEEISISVSLNVNIFSCNCVTEYEGVPAALHCDGIRRKISGMYTA